MSKNFEVAQIKFDVPLSFKSRWVRLCADLNKKQVHLFYELVEKAEMTNNNQVIDSFQKRKSTNIENVRESSDYSLQNSENNGATGTKLLNKTMEVLKYE